MIYILLCLLHFKASKSTLYIWFLVLLFSGLVLDRFLHLKLLEWGSSSTAVFGSLRHSLCLAISHFKSPKLAFGFDFISFFTRIMISSVWYYWICHFELLKWTLWLTWLHLIFLSFFRQWLTNFIIWLLLRILTWSSLLIFKFILTLRNFNHLICVSRLFLLLFIIHRCVVDFKSFLDFDIYLKTNFTFYIVTTSMIFCSNSSPKSWF